MQMPNATQPTWDVFCRVIDNHGDLGVCWRLAADLARRGIAVRLWVDDASALAWMAPQGAAGVSVLPWRDGIAAAPGDVVVEAFGCDPPATFVQRMAACERPPVWINLEYLSAEDYVERSHGLRSPQLAGPGAGLTKWFFYPGFTAATGGLIHEPGLTQQQDAFDASAWLAAHGLSPREGERRVSLFCYENPALPALLQALSDRPTLLLAAQGHAARQVAALLGPGLALGPLRAALLPPLAQPDFDRLLWACDLNLVRGEDSLVRAMWAGRPWLWQIYPQSDGAHAEKLGALLDRFLAGAAPALAERLRRRFAAWNGLPGHAGDLAWNGDDAPWPSLCRNWRDTLLQRQSLTDALIGFATERR